MIKRPHSLRDSMFARILVATVIGLLAAGSTLGEAHAQGTTRAPATSGSKQGVIPAKPIALGYKWIDIDISGQRLVAYVGRTPVFSTRISSGVARHPTVLGTFRVYTKLTSTRMAGGVGKEHYDLPNVPNTMYFYGGYGIHGAYWHNNFGRPMSHGCINLSLSAAQWMFNWTPVGTTVVVHQ